MKGQNRVMVVVGIASFLYLPSVSVAKKLPPMASPPVVPGTDSETATGLSPRSASGSSMGDNFSASY